MLIRVNFRNYPDRYQCGHFFIREGVSGKYIQKGTNNAFHGFHIARFTLINANMLPENQLAGI